MPVPSLRGKRIVVIGGTSGIGEAVVESALAEGAEVVIGSSNIENIAATLAKHPKGTSGHAIDVRNEASVAAFFTATGAFDHLVYTAGDWGHAGPPIPLSELDLKTAAAGYDVRYWGALACIKHAQGHITAGGSVVLTDGVLAHRPRKGAAVMSSMLGGIEHLARALAVELAPLRVNVVCPGIVLTERWKKLPDDQRNKMTAHQPLPRCAEPGEIAETYLYLMRGGYITGQTLIVDGGRTLV
jgi:NAD(P)-dependent dehydrogenase (short-subunit alcohol dehydrogenase family)